MASGSASNWQENIQDIATGIDGISTNTPAKGQATMANSSPVVIASNQSAVPISAASLPLPTGAAQESGGNLAAIKTDADTLVTNTGRIPAQGQAVMASSLPVTMASDQSAVPVSGTVTANAGTNLNTSALALETGGNLALIKTDADSIVTNTGNTATGVGAVADSAYAGSGSSSLIAGIKGLYALLAGTLTSNTTDRWARQVGQVDLARVLGAALAPSNPVITETNILNWIRAGNGFYASTDMYTSSAANNAFSLFNPAASGKTILLFSFVLVDGTSTDNTTRYRIVNSDPAFGNTLSAANHNLGNLNTGSATASVASVTYATVSTSAPSIGAASVPWLANTNVSTGAGDQISNNSFLVLGAGTGFACYFGAPTSNNIAFTARWIEY